MAQCQGLSRTTGLPCKRQASVGMDYCQLHGGANPASKIKAEQMLAQARLPACEALYTIIEQHQSKPCGTCGFPSGDPQELKIILRACQVILDRSGMGPRSTVEMVPQSDGDENLDHWTVEEIANLDYLLEAMDDLKARVRLRLGALVAQSNAAPVDPKEVH